MIVSEIQNSLKLLKKKKLVMYDHFSLKTSFASHRAHLKHYKFQIKNQSHQSHQLDFISNILLQSRPNFRLKIAIFGRIAPTSFSFYQIIVQLLIL